MQGCLHTQLNWSNRWSNKQNACLQFGLLVSAYLLANCSTRLHSKQAQQAAQSYFLFYFVVWHTGDKVQSIHQLLGYVHDSSGYKCLRPGSHHQVVSPLSSRLLQDVLLCNSCHSTGLSPSQPWAICLWCDVLWGDLGSIRSSADAWFTM